MRRLAGTIDRVMSEQPFEVLIIILCLLTGPPMALGLVPPPRSIAALPVWLVHSWGALLTAGGLASLIGLAMSNNFARRRFIEGLYTEAGGLIAMGSGALALAVCVLATAATTAVFGALTYVAFAAACFWRHRTLRRTVRKMKEAVALEVAVIERREQDGD